MWVVYSKPGDDGLRLDKGSSVEHDTRYWLRPGKTYKAARSTEDTDFYLTAKRHSRKDPHFTLTASSVDPAATLIDYDNRAVQYSYTVKINAVGKAIYYVPESAGPNAAEVEVPVGTSLEVHDNQQIRILKSQGPGDDAFIHFEWRPVHLYYRALKKANREQLKQDCAELGVTFSAQPSKPDALHTHYIVPQIQSGLVPPVVLSSIYQLEFVSPTWFDALKQASSTVGHKRCKLEADWMSSWPSEGDYFPAVDGKDNNLEERNVWKPSEGRRSLFEGITFVDYSGDPNIADLIVAAKGKALTASLASSRAFSKDIEDFKTSWGVKQRDPIYVVLPLTGIFTNEEDLPLLLAAQQSVGITGFLKSEDLMTSVRDVKRLSGPGRTMGAKDSQTPAKAAVPAPTPPAPAATADISFPGTNPNDIAMSAPKLGGPSQPEASSTTKLSKKPRRLADKGPVDVFASMFDNDPAPGPSVGLTREKSETQGLSSMDQDNASMGSSIGSSKAQPFVPREGSKYAKLKRRAGTGGTSQTAHAEEMDEAPYADQPPTKKFKSFDPDVESATSQASQTVLRKQKQKEEEERRSKQLTNIAEEEEPPSTGDRKATGKRKAAEVLSGSDEQDAARQVTQGTSRKKAKDADSGKKLSSKDEKAAQKAAESAKQAKYLQISTGRRKVNATDAGFNEEFNKLKIVKPARKESHKMGWNERDRIQEELEDDVDWRPEDKSTFFQIQYVSMARPEAHKPVPQVSVDPRYAGKPNFKAFRPKNGGIGMQVKPRRQNTELVASEPLGYGLKESYTRGSAGADDSEEDIQMPMADFTTKRKGKSKAPQKAPSARKGKQKAIVSESEEEEEEDLLSSDEEVAAATATNNRRGTHREMLTIESESDDDTGRTFTGFGARSQSRATQKRSARMR